jgi:hypothetical protein
MLTTEMPKYSMSLEDKMAIDRYNMERLEVLRLCYPGYVKAYNKRYFGQTEECPKGEEAILDIRMPPVNIFTEKEYNMTRYESITIEFDGPIMYNDKLICIDVTLEEAKEKFKKWCDSYQVTVESRNPRYIEYVEYSEAKGVL